MIVYDTFLYVIFKIIQFTGTFLFVTNNLSLDRHSMIRAFSESSTLIKKNGNKIVYEEKAFRDSYKKIYLNCISFALILISLIMDAFNIKVAEQDSPVLAACTIILVAYILSYLTRQLVTVIVNKKEIPPITSKELKMLGLSPDVEVITEQKIDKKIETKAQEVVSKNVEELLEQTVNKNVEKIVNKNVEKKVEKIVEKKVQEKVDEKIEEVKTNMEEDPKDKPKEFKMK